MAVILDATEKARLQEIVTRMTNGEKGLHTKTVGPLKMVRIADIPWALIGMVRVDVAQGKLVYLKTFKGIDFYERRTVPPR